MKRKVYRWIKEISGYLLLAIVLTSAVDWYRSQDVPLESAPALVSQGPTGEKIDVIAMSYDTPVVVYFWATWCAACKFVTPTVDWVRQYYPVVAVSGASGSSERVKAFMQAHDYQFTNINDEHSQLFKQWGISVTPTLFIVKDGQIKSVTTGITTPPGLLARLWLNN
ncbi:protein disulfide oxidoreductase [Vibrio aquaticus]|uniref:Protein disulfide oxidoreductase n=1 Tax=Vibrio aquaticus TaxID=2496559 RepID=A0A3S0PR40_9VIBR|nr:protein disulfide oxidoreductase [Vibrio aquaticus]RTZ18045.1 protein disulfide oxidoreductase [Vibrio aquaticus]